VHGGVYDDGKAKEVVQTFGLVDRGSQVVCTVGSTMMVRRRKEVVHTFGLVDRGSQVVCTVGSTMMVRRRKWSTHLDL
jgi:predicted site-specific integrase-resolvase